MATENAGAGRFPLIKQIAAVRRKPQMTRKEYCDYHFQVHGAIADAPNDPDLKPHKYIQSHVFDSAFGARPDAPVPNANHAWTGRDGATELWFRDVAHMLGNFRSEHVRATVGPDARNFADLEANVTVMAVERAVPLSSGFAVDEGAGGGRTTALFWIATPDGARDGAAAEKALSPLLREALETHARGAVGALLVNVGVTLEGFDPTDYFGGKGLPRYALVYKVYLKGGAEGAKAVRRAQKAFEEVAGREGRVDLGASFVLFCREGVVMDVGEGVKFDKKRQPVLKDLL